MKILLHLLFAVMFLALTQSAEAVSDKQTVSCQLIFAIDYRREIMESKGYKFIGEGTCGKYKTNYFGARDADIVVKNGKGEIIGVCKTKFDGTFDLTMDRSNFYQILVEYSGRKIEKTISNTDAIKTIWIDIGRFESHEFYGSLGND